MAKRVRITNSDLPHFRGKEVGVRGRDLGTLVPPPVLRGWKRRDHTFKLRLPVRLLGFFGDFTFLHVPP